LLLEFLPPQNPSFKFPRNLSFFEGGLIGTAKAKKQVEGAGNLRALWSKRETKLQHGI
jgi:hypothetical protein